MKIVYAMAIVGFPAIQPVYVKLNKFDYAIPDNLIMNPYSQNTMEYNYIRTEDYLEQNMIRYQDVDINFHHHHKD